MTGPVWALIAIVTALTAVTAVGVVWGARTIRRLAERLNGPATGTGTAGQPDRPITAEQEHQERTLAALRAAADEATAAVEQTRTAATAARTDAAAAQAEAAAARAEASRVLDTARSEATRVLAVARADADTVLERAHRQAEGELEQARVAAHRAGEREAATLTAAAREHAAELDRREHELDRREKWDDERERRHAAEVERLAERERRLAAAETELAAQAATVAEQRAELAESERHRLRELERVAGLSGEAARAELVAAIEDQAKREAAVLVRNLEADARRTGEQRARHIVVDAIQRVASEQTTESAVSVLHLPSDEMKGRIIGREGRNIRAFESVTGVNLIVDDTPEAVLLSCFDPVRRETGRVTLERLVADGRIHPHRIEEVFESAQQEVAGLCQRAAEDALVQVGITDLHPELVTLLGRLRYRTSYGQNVLRHLVESAHLAGLMAGELRLDPAQARVTKRGAFLHDIGKALTHEAEGSHARVGAEVARRYGEPDQVVHAIEAHHHEVTPQTIEAVLTQAADACSGGRPGARREGLEAYVKRLERIEQIAAGKPGVEKAYAMQAGREVRVMVCPDQVDDIGAAVLARDVAKQVEEELTYPGQIRVTVIRELRATETAR
ncbi:MAG: ribonuclease Y [Micromonosporaceae bacterium]|nr:ribonuclease Y [Micromonosporaceae bacterium]